jgi:predicted AAA+ superfamily ATPase
MIIEKLLLKSKKFVKLNSLAYKRYFIKINNFEHRLSIITGARGIGKTTLLAQYMDDNFDATRSNEALYVSLDDITNINLSIYDIASEFELLGGKLLCFDEIHKYDNWSQELKNIYDTMPNLKLIATGSSALEIHKGSHDLSRRAIIYKMNGLSFREYLELNYNIELSVLTLEDILTNHQDIAFYIIEKLQKLDQKIIPLIRRYFQIGYYPYYLSIPNDTMFYHTLRQNINVSIESDLLSIYPQLDGNSIKRLKLLLTIIMKSVPFIPNLSKLKQLVGVADDRTIKEYFVKLEDARLVQLLLKSPLSIRALEKPEKIYLDNTNLLYLVDTKIGTVRETFFLNQLKNYFENKNFLLEEPICASNMGDFLVEGRYTFEIGGKNKSFNQIKDLKDSFVVADDVEIGFANKIPLWLFGFLY